MLKVGITGGIGSGKSTVCKRFEDLGVPVYYADDRAKWLMNNNATLKQALIDEFGTETYQNGELNRPYLANIVFKDKKKLEALNSLVHPAVFEDGANWQTAQAKAGHAYTLKEAALLFESGSYRSLDKIIVVSAPPETRISRVMKRDQTTRQAVLDRISKQMPEDQKVEKADFVIENIDLDKLQAQVEQIHQQLTALAQ